MTKIFMCDNRELAQAIYDNTPARGFTKIVNDALMWFFDFDFEKAMTFLNKTSLNLDVCEAEELWHHIHIIRSDEQIPYRHITAVNYSYKSEGDEFIGCNMVLTFSDGTQKVIPAF